MLSSLKSTSVKKKEVNLNQAALMKEETLNVTSVEAVLDVCPPLTDGGDVCDHEVPALRHDGLQTHALQAGGQLPPAVVQHGRQLLEVTLRRAKQLVLPLKSTSYCLLEKKRAERDKR